MLLPLRFTCLLFTLIMLVLPKANSETDHGCSVPNIDLQKCLNQSKNSLSIEDSCCGALNQIAEDGFKCLCSLITATPITLVGPPLSLPFLNCFISIPPLSLCPASLAPMAVLVAPESQEEQNQLSSPADVDVVVSYPPPTNLTVDGGGGGENSVLPNGEENNNARMCLWLSLFMFLVFWVFNLL